MQSILSGFQSYRPVNFSEETKIANWSKGIETVLAITLFLLPTFFLPLTADYLTLNKTYLVALAAGLSMLMMTVDFLQRKRFIVLAPSAYISIVLFLVGVVYATLSSQSVFSSTFGRHMNYSISLVFFLSLFVLAFVAANNKLNPARLIKAIIIGVGISTLVSIVAMFVAIPGLTQAPSMISLMGNTFTMHSLQILAIVFGTYYFLNHQGAGNKVITSIPVIICAFYLIVGMEWFALAIALLGLIFVFASTQNAKKQMKSVGFPVVVIIALSAGFFYLKSSTDLNIPQLQGSPRLSVAQSWVIATQSIRDLPFKGTGLGNYHLNYGIYRPQSLNSESHWDLKLNHPFNDFFAWLSIGGLVGFAAYVLFWVFALKLVFGLNKDRESNFALSFGTVAILVMLVLNGYNPILYVLLFVLLGIAMQRFESKVVTSEKPMANLSLLVVSLAFIGFVGYAGYINYLSQVYFGQALRQENLAARHQWLTKAIQVNRNEPAFHHEFIGTSLAIARALSQPQEGQSQLPQEQVSQVSQFVRLAHESANYLTSVIAPLDSTGWAIRGDLYASLIGVTENVEQMALESYSKAVQLEPTNPKYWLGAGSVYYRIKDYRTAVSTFARAVQLKNNYANAHYNLAHALKEAGDANNAVVELEIVSRLVAKDTTEYNKVQTELEEFKALAKNAQDSEPVGAGIVANPDEIEGLNEPQEPLENPATGPETQVTPNDELNESLQNVSENGSVEGASTEENDGTGTPTQTEGVLTQPITSETPAE